MKTEDMDYIKELIRKWKDKEGNLVMILHEVQDHYGYIPRRTSMDISEELDIPLARIYEVITFYNYFNLTPPARHRISVCMGTACYLKGAPEILREIKTILNVEEGHTTADGNFYLDTVRCLGCCGLSPVIMIDGKIYGQVQKSDVMDTISRYVEEKENAKAK
jgi:NADH-quinone oxidoreductase subunit E